MIKILGTACARVSNNRSTHSEIWPRGSSANIVQLLARARQAEEAQQKRLREARTRSEKSRALAQAEAERERAPANEEVDNCHSPKGKLDVTEETQEKGEDEGQNEGDFSVCQGWGDNVSSSAEVEEKKPVERRQDRQGKKRLASAVEKYGLVYVPAMVPTEHASWADFDANLKEYMRKTRQVLVVGETFNVGRRNAALPNSVCRIA
ncbi:hypothetical protein PI124_g13132 [Phytophthora idaei]|nr:hypothetical protein PI124_g13132 [Phytophthora idaei]